MILSATNAPPVTESATAKANAATDPAAAQDRFLKLLVAQLNNQDPMNPLDNAQMTSQMAQINTVTGIQQLNQTMQGMAAQFGAMQMLQGASMVGRSVVTEGNRVQVAEGVGKGMFDLAGSAASVKVEVVTPGGQVVGTVDLGSRNAGRHAFEWDASKYQGDPAQLRFRVTAMNGNTAVGTTPLQASRVVAASTETGALGLTLDTGTTVGYDQVRAIL